MLKRTAILSSLLISAHFCFATTPVSLSQKKHPIRQAQSINGSDKHIINIGFLYTNDLIEQLNRQQIDLYIEEQINAANVVLENSGLAIQRNVAYVGEYPILNQPDIAINQFLSTIYQIDAKQLDDLRTQYGLDYITILRPHTDPNYCGWAYYDNPYAVMEVGGNCTSETLGAHEWGHNDGSDHDIINSSDVPVRNYARGYNCGDEGTIMSTSNNWNTRHNFYSTPNIVVNEQACGDEEEANIVRMLNEFKDIEGHLGNKIETPNTLGYAVINNVQEHIPTEGGQVQFTVELVDNEGFLTSLDKEASIEVFTTDGTAEYNVDYDGLASRLIFFPGENQKTVVLQTKRDSEIEAQESVFVSLRYGDIINNREQSIEIFIADDSDKESYQFKQDDISINSGDEIVVTVSKLGNLDVETSVVLTSNESKLIPQNDLLTFGIGESQKTISFATNKVTSQSITLTLEDLINSNEYDQLIVMLNRSTKSGGGYSVVFIIVVLLLSVLRKKQG